MKSSQEQIEYKRKLEEIKRNPDRLARIQQVYELVVETMGPYDENLTFLGSGFNGSSANPGNIVNRAAKLGTGGVCRQHSTLLHWSLLQVARPENERNMELTENSFSAGLKFGSNSVGGHTWVRVNLPYRTNQGLAFKVIDLDTTHYEKLTILNARLRGLEPIEQQKVLATCRQIATCLSMSKLNSQLPKSSKTRSVSSEKKK